MNEQYEIFDAARKTLCKGVNFVEASAGTGKTYTITMVVLRGVVELEIPIENILIVTFTKAATEELKSRIRERLVEVRNLLAPQGKANETAQDATVSAWLTTITNRETALQKIQQALYDIDRAAIFTIHGFCQRMLAEQALESGQLFEVELMTSVEKIRQQAAEDFWRNHIYSLSTLCCAIITTKFGSPGLILSTISQTFGGNSRIEPEPENLQVNEIVLTLEELFTELSDWWEANRKELHTLFSGAIADGFFKKKGVAEKFAVWIQDVDNFFSGEYALYPDDIQLFSRSFLVNELNGNRLRGEKKKQDFLDSWPLGDDSIEQFVQAAENLCLSTRLHLAFEIKKEVQSRLEMQAKMGFDDLIRRLSSSLEGDNGPFLKKAIGDKFAIALIDEFQDTDMDQYHIFSSLFDTKEHYLYLIGDPKQAIYKFRGADIYSYFHARKRASSYLTLAKNYRSHPFLIKEINRLFGSRENPFWFREEILPYRKVQPAKKADDMDIHCEGRSLAGMKYCHLPPNPKSSTGRWTSATAANGCMSFVVGEIITLLDRDKVVTLVGGELEEHLNPKDIAILVRSNKQAEQYRSALVAAGVPAVVTSKQSVYKTVECRDLYSLLLAVISAGEISRLKTAMVIPWFGYNGDQLYKIWRDEEAVSLWHERFYQYNLLWLEKGFLPMMTKLLNQENVYPNLARRPLAERSIANISQLLELLQEKESADNLGSGQLLQWLQSMIQDGREGEDSELLLESDEDAVHLVTMHGAKGLEYPVVFCPYLWYRSNRLKSEKYQVKCFEKKSGVVVDLGSELFQQRRQQALDEELAEDLRLLYVSMTRGKVCCYTMWVDVQGGGFVADSFSSALGYLLFSSERCSHAEQVDIVSRAAENEAAHYQLIPLETNNNSYKRIQSQGNLKALQPSQRSLHTDWQMSSFSGLATLSEYSFEQNYGSVRGETGDLKPLSQLPAGPHFGNVIHELLEQNSFSNLQQDSDEHHLLAMVEETCSRNGVVCDPGDVCSLLHQIVSTPLIAESRGGEFSLAALGEGDCLKEMGFYFHLSELRTEEINTIFTDEKSFVPLAHKALKGYLTGFVDLIGRFDNRYYIVDYKTNYLGEQIEDYAPDQLVDAMASHNYGLQYWIYTLVLHRHLSNLLPDYSYESYFGGVIYLFVRGMSVNFPGYGIFHTVPDYNLLEKFDKALGGDNE